MWLKGEVFVQQILKVPKLYLLYLVKVFRK